MDRAQQRQRRDCRQKWVETKVRGDLWQKDRSNSEIQSIKDNSFGVWFGGKGTDKKTEERAEDFMLFTGSDQDRAEVEMFSKSVRGKVDMEEDHSEDW